MLRTGVGILSWASPAGAWRAFALGSIDGDPRAGLITRLFGSRDLALGVAVLCPEPTVRRSALQAGVAIDSVDAVASVLALRKGAPRWTALTAVAGATFFAALGAVALKQEPERPVAGVS
ncbi:MAG: hypothetical protein U0W40_16380 [Acidimicrobiia bacterium]